MCTLLKIKNCFFLKNKAKFGYTEVLQPHRILTYFLSQRNGIELVSDLKNIPLSNIFEVFSKYINQKAKHKKIK